MLIAPNTRDNGISSDSSLSANAHRYLKIISGRIWNTQFLFLYIVSKHSFLLTTHQQKYFSQNSPSNFFIHAEIVGGNASIALGIAWRV